MITRVARRWNQTGQKFSGEPDIARTFFFEHRLILWSLVGITYLWNLQWLASRSFPNLPQLAGGLIATALATAGLTFKLAFTNEDSPELMAGLAKAMVDREVGLSLVIRARAVFLVIGMVLVYTLISGMSHKRPNRSSSISTLQSHIQADHHHHSNDADPPRSPHPPSRHPIASYKHSSPPSLRDPILPPARPQPLPNRNHNHELAPTTRILLCLWWLKRHLLH